MPVKFKGMRTYYWNRTIAAQEPSIWRTQRDAKKRTCPAEDRVFNDAAQVVDDIERDARIEPWRDRREYGEQFSDGDEAPAPDLSGLAEPDTLT